MHKLLFLITCFFTTACNQILLDTLNNLNGLDNKNSASSDSFVSIWRVGDPSFGDGDLTVSLPLRSGYQYDFTVDWGDGSDVQTVSNFNDININHTYSQAGDYTITLSGLAEAWHFNNTGDKDKIVEVVDFGDMGWTDLEQAFYGCFSLVSFAGGNTSNVTTFRQMFWGATALSNADVTSFDTRSATHLGGMFAYTYALTHVDLSSFDTSNVTALSSFFSNARALVSVDMSHFDTSNVTTMGYMFHRTYDLESVNANGWDVSNVTTTTSFYTASGADFYCDQGGSPGTGSLIGETCLAL